MTLRVELCGGPEDGRVLRAQVRRPEDLPPTVNVAADTEPWQLASELPGDSLTAVPYRVHVYRRGSERSAPWRYQYEGSTSA